MKDTRHQKPAFTFLASALLTAAAFLVLAFFGTGTKLTGLPGGNCVLEKRTLFKKTTETFSWKEITAVRLTGAMQQGSRGGNARGTAGENLALETATGKTYAVFLRNVAWPFGSLNRKTLVEQVGRPLVGEWWGVSLGGPSWFISFILAAIAGVIVLMHVVIPIIPGMEAGLLRKARMTNLYRFLFLVFGAAGFWGLTISLLIRWLRSGAFPKI